ncbi:hypothetical protein Nepgr_009026 [Nepenthes gracilis]|uniref:Uncharacterized protein n=1 Tax=Nepenthes gracilis TaxID=150966 RepID=A0AAD3XK16_NEPGR|nr:hypothetical protein Nepgr_009026 [Nepenthes gracilis]
MCYVGKATKIFIFIVTVVAVITLVLGFGLLRRGIKKFHKCADPSCRSSPIELPKPNASSNPNLNPNPNPSPGTNNYPPPTANTNPNPPPSSNPYPPPPPAVTTAAPPTDSPPSTALGSSPGPVYA